VQYCDAAPEAALWLDQSDLWSEFARREALARRGIARLSAGLQCRSIVGREDVAVARADVVSAAGWTDARVLRGRTGASVRWLPTAVPAARATPATRRDATTPTIGYFANFAYHPNVDALELLVERWLPALRARGWRLLVAGLGSDDLRVPDDVIVEGPVDTIDDFYAAVDATAAPVRLGGGMKVKVAESLLEGRPVVATEFAVEGFPDEIRDHCLVVDVDRPDFSALDGLAPVELPATLRELFTTEGFTSEVGDALADAR
jgi:glycosyltransferase involved in cell wall biosynthesis